MLLATYPVTKDLLRIETVVNTSNHHARTLKISDLINASDQKETLNDLWNGIKNLIIATSVCEEGMDIAVCNVVICFKSPPSLNSFIQRRGRARSTKSKYIVMFQRAREDTSRVIQDRSRDERESMSHVEEIERLEAQEDGHREFIIELTK